MKKHLLVLVLALTAIAASHAQTSVHLYYDFGKHLYKNSGPEGNSLAARYYMTSTVEHFSADAWGSTYFFVDMYYGNTAATGAKGGCLGAYWEIGRDLNFWQKSSMGWLSAHVEYDGGLDNMAGGTYSDAWLVGPNYSGHNADFSKTWSLGVFYKRMGRNAFDSRNGFQVTGVWGLHFCERLLTFSGFFDVWNENTWFNPNSNITFITEPQFWVNLNALKGLDKLKLSVGTEVELSNNFVGAGPGFYCIPTLAVKWTF